MVRDLWRKRFAKKVSFEFRVKERRGDGWGQWRECVCVGVLMQCGKVQQAIDTCVNLNQWNMAIDLAHGHNVRDTEPLLVKYAETLLDQNKTFSAIELYRKANHQVDAAKLLFEVWTSSVRCCVTRFCAVNSSSV